MEPEKLKMMLMLPMFLAILGVFLLVCLNVRFKGKSVLQIEK